MDLGEAIYRLERFVSGSAHVLYVFPLTVSSESGVQDSETLPPKVVGTIL